MARPSPSSRRAWIEIPFGMVVDAIDTVSLSPRRAWIEIYPHTAASGSGNVALLAEGVD